MGLKKASEETQTQSHPVSFRFTPELHAKLELMCKVLGKKKSRVVEEAIIEAYEGVLRDYPEDVRVAQAKLKKTALKGK